MTDLYADLGIPRTASPEDVKKAHRRKAKETHPDKPGGSREKFAKVQRAYLVLSDTAKRQKYDTTGDEEVSQPDNREAQAREIVAHMLQNAIQASDQTVFREDIFTGFRERAMKPAIQKIRNDQASYRRQIERNEKFLAKVKRKKKGGIDLVKNLIDGMNAELHRNIARADEAISFHERALEIIAEYEFEFEKQQQVQFYATAVNSQTGSWFKL